MRTVLTGLALVLALVSVPVWAQETKEKATEPAAPAPAAAEKTAVTEATTYETGSWLTWKKMTGNWGGLRTDLADKGITFDLDVTQIIQDNMHGGADTKNGFRYSGSTDLTLKLNTGKMGLWPGGELMFAAESKWGDGINEKVGALMPVNMDAVKPGAGEGCMFTLSEWIYTQVLAEGKLILIGGKLDGSRAFDRNTFANDERTQFMNVALRNNMLIPAFLPYTNMGLGFIVNPVDWVSITTAVADSEGQAKTTGFETAFHGPTHTTVIHEWAFKLKPFDKPGNYRVGFVWSSMERSHLQPPSPFKETGPLMMSLLGMKRAQALIGWLGVTDTSADNVAIYTNFDQYFYTEPGDPTQGVGLFGRFGWARSDVNPVDHYYSIGVGGKGVIPSRDQDTFGVGYYYLSLSHDMPDMFQSEQGVECYYNVEIAPWMHLTPDLQIIVNPGSTDANDVAIVGGLRLQINL